MEYTVQFQKLFQIEARRYVLIVGIVAITYLVLQSFMLPYGNALKSLLPDNEVFVSVKGGFSSSQLLAKSEKEGELNPLAFVGVVKEDDRRDGDVSIESEIASKEIERIIQDIVPLEGKGQDRPLRVDKFSDRDFVDGIEKNNLRMESNDVSKTEKEGEINHSDLVGLENQDDHRNEDEVNGSDNASTEVDRTIQDDSLGFDRLSGRNYVGDIQKNRSWVESNHAGKIEHIVGPEHQVLHDSRLELNASSSSDKNENAESWNQAELVLPVDENKFLDGTGLAALRNNSEAMGTRRRKKVKPGMPPISVVPIDKMNRILARHLTFSTKMKPQWSSLHDPDKEIFDAKLKIINSHVADVDKELYAPLFRNVSMFMRSYELMEKTLKVYVYKDGRKPIFHQPILKGLYASEGWFMKLMEGNKHFVVKNPKKAHLFYMPFSSRMLEYALYVPNSHTRANLRQFVKNYTEAIAAKYPFWNRTGGTDHFVVACHDWAPYETRHHMENSIKALCNADVTIGFKIGRDVSLPETFVRYARNPLRDIGGKPPSERNILAFYAGNNHGYLRPTLLKDWKDKDPDMRIYGLLPTSVSRRMNYLQHMKSSKYCICPKGHEVNSPRIVEAIFYECVPVIISDNFVLPFFEVLNWEAFSVIVPEKDIPNLKNILVSIPEEKYIEMQAAVRKVQRHFLWHARPVKYDLFHMTLHSIWYTRVFQMRKQ